MEFEQVFKIIRPIFPKFTSEQIREVLQDVIDECEDLPIEKVILYVKDILDWDPPPP
jgi:hypothetical protein